MTYDRKSLQCLIETILKSSSHFGRKRRLSYCNLTQQQKYRALHILLAWIPISHCYFIVTKALLGSHPKEKVRKAM